jgi:uncharacterized protein YbaA (DUF1428 family)
VGGANSAAEQKENPMTYIEGFVAAVPTANQEAYRKHAADALPLFHEYGVARMVENWGDDVPDGKTTDFRRAVDAKPDETIVFSWFEFPNKQTRQDANQKMMSDPRMKEMGASMPFDAKRMIYGGFEVIADQHAPGQSVYVDGSVAAVPVANKDAYCDWAEVSAPMFIEYGAVRVLEGWADDVPDGKLTDFKRAVKAGSDEAVTISWIEWPSKQVRDAAWEKIMADPRMNQGPNLHDGQRRIFGGFRPIVDA